MVIELPSQRKGAVEIRKRTAELDVHTNLSETEAFVYAAREQEIGGGAWSHSIISEYIEGGESASQNHYSRAKKKAQTAEVTHNLLNSGKHGPHTGDHPVPVDDVPSELSEDELIEEIEICEYWIDLGFESIRCDTWNLSQPEFIDLKQRKADCLTELETGNT